MARKPLVFPGTALFLTLAAGSLHFAQKPAVPSTSPKPAAQTTIAFDAQNAMVKQYCSGCHNDKFKSGDMSLTQLDLAHVEKSPELAEKVIRKLRVGVMPPAGNPRPPAEGIRKLIATLESTLDRAALLRPNPGRRPFQRLTRTEYQKSVKDLFGIDVDVAALLPADTLNTDGFDNSAESQAFSPTLMEGYMRAAAKISRDALGDPKATATSAVFKLPRTAGQLRHVDGAPMGTRGGISIVHNFPADGEYNFRSLMHGTSEGALFGWISGEQFEVSIDGDRIWMQELDPKMSETQPTGLNLTTGRVFVKAGPHRVSAAFIQKHSGVVDDNITPIEHSLADVDIGDYRELTIFPHLREFEIAGPYNTTGVSDTVSRRKIITCRPLTAGEELPCATKIITDLAAKAYRRPPTSEDLEGLMSFFDRGRKTDFETGIRTAVQAILASPKFVFRLEQQPATVKPGQTYRITDLELASRLSYFLWNTLPDAELLNIASQGRLKDPVVLEKQVRRMIADPKSETLATKFAAQWLHLADLEAMHPDAFYYPQFDHTLADAMRRETELFFDSIVREDRSVVDLLTANHSFVNERLAKHYGIPGILGDQFRRVELPYDYRRGLLGKGAILTLTSVAERTSPVQRGKWVMVVLYGTPPPPPPPVVPKLEETSAVSDGRSLTMRERMEAHRANPNCSSCHRLIDPIGLSLENFDVTGEWRDLDKTASINDAGLRVRSPGIPIDTTTTMYDGTVLKGPGDLRQAIVSRSDAFISNLTEKLMAYALGRRMEYFDMPAIRTITRDAAKNNNRFSSFVLGIVKSPAFQMSKAEAAPTDAAR